jgi:hypothetical protein
MDGENDSDYDSSEVSDCESIVEELEDIEENNNPVVAVDASVRNGVTYQRLKYLRSTYSTKRRCVPEPKDSWTERVKRMSEREQRNLSRNQNRNFMSVLHSLNEMRKKYGAEFFLFAAFPNYKNFTLYSSDYGEEMEKFLNSRAGKLLLKAIMSHYRSLQSMFLC